MPVLSFKISGEFYGLLSREKGPISSLSYQFRSLVSVISYQLLRQEMVEENKIVHLVWHCL